MEKPANIIREHVRTAYIEPAILRGAESVIVLARDVVHDLHLTNRTPAVCSAMRSWAFLRENDLTIEKDEGPPSGMSTSVKITYRLPTKRSAKAAMAEFEALRGSGKQMYAALGGGEEHLRSLREDEPE